MFFNVLAKAIDLDENEVHFLEVGHIALRTELEEAGDHVTVTIVERRVADQDGAVHLPLGLGRRLDRRSGGRRAGGAGPGTASLRERQA